MAAYKPLNSEDIIISPLQVNKSFTFQGGDTLLSNNVGIDRFLGTNYGYLENFNTTGYLSTEREVNIYRSIKQLYYTNYSGSTDGQIVPGTTSSSNPDGTIEGPVHNNNYYNYPQTTLNPYRYYPTITGSNIAVVSIPKNLFGDYIYPTSTEITTGIGVYRDNGEGVLVTSSDAGDIPVGNIIYEHGLIILTGGNPREGESRRYGASQYGIDLYGGYNFDVGNFENLVTTDNITMSFSSSFEIFETQIKCTITEDEFNFSQNPSIIKNTKGDIEDFATSSYFNPYLSTVGLYNKDKQLMAVGKLAQPLPISLTTDTTVIINLDRQ